MHGSRRVLGETTSHTEQGYPHYSETGARSCNLRVEPHRLLARFVGMSGDTAQVLRQTPGNDGRPDPAHPVKVMP